MTDDEGPERRDMDGQDVGVEHIDDDEETGDDQDVDDAWLAGDAGQAGDGGLADDEESDDEETDGAEAAGGVGLSAGGFEAVWGLTDDDELGADVERADAVDRAPAGAQPHDTNGAQPHDANGAPPQDANVAPPGDPEATHTTAGDGGEDGTDRDGPGLVRGAELGLEHRAVEAVVLCAVEPVPVGLLAELLELPPARVEQVCAELAADYRAQRRGFVLAKVAGGYRYQTDPELAPFVERFAMEGVSSRLSSAALETLAIIAYKQPVSRAQVAALRGVNVDGVVRLLNQRGLIAEVGHAPGPGQPVLYGTTPAFLEKLGLDSVGELPAVEDLFPGPEVVEVLEARLRPGADGP